MSRRPVISSLSFVFLFTLLVFPQQKTGTIKGRVIDAYTQEPLVGANIILDSAFLGTYTDVGGNYSLTSIPFGKYKLIISFIGYRNKTFWPIEVKPDTVIIINASLSDGLSVEDAWKDINKGVVQIYLCGWPIYTEEHKALAEKYGFKIAYTGCFPLNTERYDSVMIDYLKKRNGEDWYDKFLEQWNKLK